MTDASGIAAGRLQSLIQRIERLEEEKAVIANDIKEIYQEAKSAGFDTKVMRQVVRLRKMDRQEREEREQLLEVYMGALGQLADTPLGQASAPKVKPEEGDGWVDVTIMAGGQRAKGTISVVRSEQPDPDSAAQGAETAKMQTRTISAAPPDPISASLAGLKRDLAAAG